MTSSEVYQPQLLALMQGGRSPSIGSPRSKACAKKALGRTGLGSTPSADMHGARTVTGVSDARGTDADAGARLAPVSKRTHDPALRRQGKVTPRQDEARRPM